MGPGEGGGVWADFSRDSAPNIFDLAQCKISGKHSVLRGVQGILDVVRAEWAIFLDALSKFTWLVGWWVVCLLLLACLLDCLLACRRARLLACLLACLLAWLVGRSVSWFVGCLVGWLSGWLIS